MYLLNESSPILMYVLIGVGVLVVIWAIVVYNGLVRKRMTVKNSWADIDVQLQRRYDLIPNLVEIAKGYMKHEKEVLENVTAARGGCLNALKGAHGGPTPELIAAENQLGTAMRGFMLHMEAYPDLKASANMKQLTEEVTSTENKISFARQYYNDSVKTLNVAIESFPSNMMARIGGFQKANFFEVENRDAVKNAPKISF